METIFKNCKSRRHVNSIQFESYFGTLVHTPSLSLSKAQFPPTWSFDVYYRHSSLRGKVLHDFHFSQNEHSITIFKLYEFFTMFQSLSIPSSHVLEFQLPNFASSWRFYRKLKKMQWVSGCNQFRCYCLWKNGLLKNLD